MKKKTFQNSSYAATATLFLSKCFKTKIIDYVDVHYSLKQSSLLSVSRVNHTECLYKRTQSFASLFNFQQ